MNSIKEIVDKYLLENFREIQDQKEINKDFRWVNVAEVIAKKTWKFILRDM